MRTGRILAGATALGLVLGPVLDQIHVRSGALSYAHPWLLGQAWWVAPQFAVAFLLIAAASLSLLGPPPTSEGPPSRYVAWTVLAFVCAYVVTGVAHQAEWFAFGVLGVALAIRFFVELPSPRALLAITALVAGGTLYEAALTTLTGTFDYAVASLGAVPAWLPLLYAHGGFAVVALLRFAQSAESRA